MYEFQEFNHDFCARISIKIDAGIPSGISLGIVSAINVTKYE